MKERARVNVIFMLKVSMIFYNYSDHTLRIVEAVPCETDEEFELDSNPIKCLRQELTKWAYVLDDLYCKSLTNAKSMKHLKNPTSRKRTSHSVSLLKTLFLY